MDFFDCHVEFGRRTVPGPLQADDAAALESLYTEIGIQRALVTHASLHQQHPAVGNARISEETRDHPRLYPTWAILPPATEELGTVDAFLDGMRHAGVAALWAFPREHRYLLDTATFGPLFEALRAHRIPLFLRGSAFAGEAERWARLGELLRETPGLRLVCYADNVWGEDRYFRPLLDRFPDLSFCISTYLLEGGLAALCARYGAERFLFGSAFPDWQPGGCQLSLLRAGLPDADTAAIAGGNLDRLLREVTL
jgi:predicted TIM-barrel fold metal-dependent hydrolase